MFKASKELVGKEDKYVNGYGPESEEEKENDEDFINLFIKKENNIEKGIDELSESVDNFKKEIEESNKIKKEIDDEVEVIEKLMVKLDKLINEEEESINKDLKLIGGNYNPDDDPLLKGLYLPMPNSAPIIWSMYYLIKIYGERHYEIEKLIKEIEPKIAPLKIKADKYYTSDEYKFKKRNLSNLFEIPTDIWPPKKEKDKNILDYYKRLLEKEEEGLKNYETGSYSTDTEVEKEIKDDIKKYKNKLEEIENQINEITEQIREEKNKSYNTYNEFNTKLESYKNFGIKAYKNLIEKLIKKYNFLGTFAGRQQLQKMPKNKLKGRKHSDVTGQVTDILDLLQVVDTDKLNEISKEGNDARELYYQLIQSKYPDSEHKRISTNPTKREDGTRSEVLFKRFMLDKYPKYKNNPLIDFNQHTFYDRIDFDLPNKSVELKMSIDTSGDKQWLYVDKDKVDNLLKQSKPAKIFWYNSPHEGYLANMNKQEFDNINFDDYRKNLFTIKGDLTDQTFKDSDLDKKRNAYRLELDPNTDKRIVKAKSKL
jgi:hypothetical protein